MRLNEYNVRSKIQEHGQAHQEGFQSACREYNSLKKYVSGYSPPEALFHAAAPEYQ